MRNVLSVLFILTTGLLFGQTFRFNQYTTEDGISQDFIYSINQDKQGYLWVGTGEGLCKFDGKHFVTYTANDGLREVITCSFVDNSGTQWFGHNSGVLTSFNGVSFKAHDNQKVIQSKINAISGDGEKIYAVSQNEGLIEIIDGKPKVHGKFGAESFHSIQCIDKTNLLLGTSSGLIHMKLVDGKWQKIKLYWEDSWISDLTVSQDSHVFLLASQSDGIAKVRLKDGQLQFSRWDKNEEEISEFQIQKIMQDADYNIWLGTYGGGLIKIHTDSIGGGNEFELTRYNTSTGMSSDFVQSVFQDREGNIWIGTFGAGLSNLIDDFFTFYSHSPERYGNSVSSIWISGNEKWYGVENGLIRISPTLDTNWTFYDKKNKLVDDKITSLFYIDSLMWIGTANNGIYRYDFSLDKFDKIPWDYGSLQKRVNQITGDKHVIWVATEGGLIAYYPESKNTTLYDTQSGLAHNAIKTVCKDKNGIVWMGTLSRQMYAITNESIESIEITNSGELEVVSISIGLNGDIWIATAEKGVYKKNGDTFTHYSVDQGLKSNYTYAIHCDSKGNVWVGHRGALSKIFADGSKISTFDHKSGISAQINQNAMFLDEKNYLWMGSTNGAIKYDPSKDTKKMVAPVVNILEIIIGDKKFKIDEEIKLPYGEYRVHFNFIGISFLNPDKVTYQYKLEGYDQVFSEQSVEAQATYGRLTEGKYMLKVIACTEDGVCSEETASVQITIKNPFWKQIWFYLLLLVALVTLIIVIVKLRVRRFQANQIYLENQLAIKTKEVVEKAEIIQEINKDLTSSINYAERIQSAILPNYDALIDKFPGSFIFFRPRDIVSGDFYFMREYDDKLIIACVDCTGHGVPGAFMSMIGSTTLRNIYRLMESTNKWMKPDEVLDLLDEEIQKILHQRTEMTSEEDFFKSRDGMDMTLIEIDLAENIVHLSSAKRHSIILKNGVTEIISGDKRPIGGGDINEVDFSLQSFKMNKGEALFLFTDGYPDQFGGPDGRKLKLKGVEQIIQDLQSKDKSTYEETISSYFDLWKSSKEQIDDVLMIGLLF